MYRLGRIDTLIYYRRFTKLLQRGRRQVPGRSDFENLRAGFPGVNDYFHSICESFYIPSLHATQKHSVEAPLQAPGQF